MGARAGGGGGMQGNKTPRLKGRGFQGDASMRGMSAGLAKALTGIETSTRNLPYEQAYILDKNGKLVFENKNGGAHQVAYDGKLAAGNVFTHNHPGGQSFSIADVAGAVRWNMAEMRAVEKNITYSLKPGKKGWGTDSKGAQAAYRHFEEELSSEIWGYIYKYKGDRQTAIRRANALQAHLIMKKLASFGGWEYKKTKIN